MRNSIRLLLIPCLLFTFLPREALSQDGSDNRKLKQINLEIQQFEKQKKSGMLMVGSGLGIFLLGLVLFIPSTEFENFEVVDKGNTGLFVLTSLGGFGLEVYGGYQWWDASQQLAHLRAKRYDFSFAPTIIIPDSKSAIAYGAKVSFDF